MSSLNKKSIFTETVNWKGKTFVNEIYSDLSDIKNLSPITQVQAVPFLNENKVILYKHVDGYFGLPGGKVEKGENLEEALKRELDEEIGASVLDYKPIVYVKSYKQKEPDQITYNLRYVAKVELKEGSINDPAEKAIERVVVSVENIVEKLNWGKKGEILINLAKQAL